MKKMLKSALAAAALAGMGAAQATVITFDGLADSPTAPNMPFFGVGDYFVDSGFYFEPFSNQAGAQIGDFVGAIVDGADVANTCASVACPTNNPTKFYTGLNDGVLYLAPDAGGSFKLNGVDASFVGAGGEVFPSTTLLLRFQGTKVGGGTMTATFQLPGQTNGAFGFQSFAPTAAFAAQQFTEMYIFGLACNAQGSCSAFSSDKGQFALDNLNVSAIPEPSSWLMMGLGLAAFGAFARRRNAA